MEVQQACPNDAEGNHIQKLKLEMKRWEKQFEIKNGRKACKADIDKDENMKQTYIHYWKVIKNKSNKNRKDITTSKKEDSKSPPLNQSICSVVKTQDDVWGSNCNKKLNEKTNYSIEMNNKKPLSRLSTKMFQMSSDINPFSSAKKSFSLKRAKSKDSNCSSVVINSSLITLFKKPEQKEDQDELIDDVASGAILKDISTTTLVNARVNQSTETSSSAFMLSTNETLSSLNTVEEKDEFNVEIDSIISKIANDHDDQHPKYENKPMFGSFSLFADNTNSVSHNSYSAPANLTASELKQQSAEYSISTSSHHEPFTTNNSFNVPPNSSCPINALPAQNMYFDSTQMNQGNYFFDTNQPMFGNSNTFQSNTVDPFENANHSTFALNSQMEQSFEFATLIPNMIETMNSNHSSLDVVEASSQVKNHHSNFETSFTQPSSQSAPSYFNLDAIETKTTTEPISIGSNPNPSFLNENVSTTLNQMFTPIKKNARQLMNMTVEFSPMKDAGLVGSSLVDQVKLLKVPTAAKRSNTTSEIQTSDNEELFANSDHSHDEDEGTPMDTFEGVTTANQTALFDINLQPTDLKTKISRARKKTKTAEDPNASDDEQHKDVKSLTKQRKKNTQKDANFRRLEFKKKVYSRGHKKFNTSKYKREQWKKLQNTRGTGCFKCGDPNHWAQDCLRDAVMDDNAFDAEMEQLAIEKDITNLSVLPNENFTNIQFTETQVDEVLQGFGHKEFRANQRETILRVLNGRSCLFISPTGSGKSLCYQIPAYLYGKHCNYITIIVSPLISLMEDQVLCLPNGLKGCYLHSGLTEGMKRKQMQMIQDGEAHLLYLSPEYIMGNLLELSLLPPIAFVCIDEAHCLSEWSNNFRPSYLQLFKTLKSRLNIRTFLALTATANKQTARQIVRNLGINVEDIIGQTRIPENLVLTVSRDPNKDFALIDLLKSERFSSLKSIIIYCNRREVTERLATLIRMEMQHASLTGSGAWTACAYHAGLSYHTRKEIQTRFISGELRVIVATIAFGMGINKSDVRAIIHYNLPKTFENYVQEIGRAGRDGHRAECHLFLDQNGDDLFEQQKHVYANGVDRSNIRKFVNKVFKSCKCKQLHSIESDGEANEEVLDSNRKKVRKCPGHEKAFSIKDTTQELDLKEETVLTLLLFMELNCNQYKISVLNYTNSKCRLLCYRNGGEQMEQLAKKYPFIAIPLANHKRTTGRPTAPEMLEFSHVDVGAMLGQESIFVRRQLKALEWDQNASTGQKSRSSVRVEFSELSFHVISPGDLTDEELDEVARTLLNYSRAQENKEIGSLKKMYDTFREFSQQRCTNKINQAKSREVRRILNTYFDLTDLEKDDEHALEQMASQAIQSQELRPVGDAELSEARASIASLIRLHHDQCFTPRAVARILQGIASPKYPLDVWGRDKRFWRKCLKVDFNTLVRIATEELVRYKC